MEDAVILVTDAVQVAVWATAVAIQVISTYLLSAKPLIATRVQEGAK